MHVFRPAKYRNAKRSPLPSDILKYRIQTGRAPIAVDGVERSIKIILNPDEYHQAVLAHDTKVIVACSGNVHIKNHRAMLLNPTGFRIIASDKLL